MRLHLLDATYELFRAYFAMPSLHSPDGREVGAVRGVMASVLALLQEPQVTHLAAATDQVIRSFRNDLFPGYKSEVGVPHELLEQFPLVERALEALGVRVWAMDLYEADDALASGAARFAAQVDQVVILTPDKDLAQCVQGERVVLRDRRRGITYDQTGVEGKFGVPPESIPDYLALVGDSADGLPGLVGWGAKSSAAVLRRYRRLEAIPLQGDLWEVDVRAASRLAESLQRGMAEALVYRYLATLRRDVPLSDSLDGLRWRGVPRSAFLKLCDELGFEEIRDRPHRWSG
ncbi:MAG: 5'-3' exonuclease [Actinomycetota bacterium]|nr:5'-3' exonuclease [Actinomycetota bacterium]